MASHMLKLQDRSCAHCDKAESDDFAADRTKLKACAKCRTVMYCSKFCQIADRKAGHKSLCIPPSAEQEEAAREILKACGPQPGI